MAVREKGVVMNKRFSPMNTRDHLVLDVKFQLKIGVSDCESEESRLSFIADLTEKVRMTGANIILSNVTIDSKHPFDGSTREKFYMDRCYEESSYYSLDSNE